MNIFANIFFLFIFSFITFFFNLPNISDGRALLHKLIIFVATFIFQALLLIISKIRRGCKIEAENISKSAFETSLLSVIGYSIFTDLRNSNGDIGRNIQLSNPNMQYVYASLCTTILLVIVQTVKIMFGHNINACVK